MSYEINILHLYPNLLNLYGDKGNIMSLEKRLLWRNISANVTVCNAEDTPNIENADIILLGGGPERETQTVVSVLKAAKASLSDFIESGKTLIALCSGFEILGKTYPSFGKSVQGLEILDIDTIPSPSRFIGNVIIENPTLGKISGFENHGGKTDIGSYTPLGKVITGYGNDGSGQYEGLLYKNVVASNLHGPLLPKNPALCDMILENTLKHKYPDFKKLTTLDDSLENSANNYIWETFGTQPSK